MTSVILNFKMIYPAELCLFIKKEQAFNQHLKVIWNELLKSLGKHQMINKDEIFIQLIAIKQKIYFAEQHIQELNHTFQQAEQRDLYALAYETWPSQKYTQGSKIAFHWYEARDLFATHFSSVELQTCLHNEFLKLSHRPKEPVKKVIKRIGDILQQMTKQPFEAQKIATLKHCLNLCLLESVSNMLFSQNTEKYEEAIQIALSVEANFYTHTKLPLVQEAFFTQHLDIQQLNMKDGTQMLNKANTSQCHNGNNNRSSSSSSSSSGYPLSSNKHTCHKCSAPWHPGHQCKPCQPVVLNTSQAQISLPQQLALASLPPSSPSSSPALSPFGTNQPFTNALDATIKQEFMEAVYHTWEIQGNVELAAIDLNSLLYPGNASDSVTDAPSPVVTLEAIHVEGLNTDNDNNDIEDNCKDKVEPPITAPILLNHQHATAFIDSSASHSFISPATAERYLHPISCKCHHTIISNIDDMEITLGNRSTTHVTCHAAHIHINCGSYKLFLHFLIMPLQGEHEIQFGRDIM